MKKVSLGLHRPNLITVGRFTLPSIQLIEDKPNLRLAGNENGVGLHSIFCIPISLWYRVTWFFLWMALTIFLHFS